MQHVIAVIKIYKFVFQTTMMVLCTCLVALLLTFYSTIYGGKIMYFIWVCGLFFSFAGTFSLFPTVIAKSYGPKYMPVNFGLLFTSQVSPLGLKILTFFCINFAFHVTISIEWFENCNKLCFLGGHRHYWCCSYNILDWPDYLVWHVLHHSIICIFG